MRVLWNFISSDNFYKYLCFFLFLSLGAGSVWYIGTNKLLYIISNISFFWIFFSFALYGASWASRAWRLERLAFQLGKKISIFEIFKIHIVGYAINILLPGKPGDFAMAGYLRYYGLRLGQSGAIVLQSRILDIMALGFFAFIFLIFLLEENILNKYLNFYSVAFILLFCFLFFVLVFFGKNFLRYFMERSFHFFNNKYFKIMLEKFVDLCDAYCRILRDFRFFGFTFLISSAVWMFEGFTCVAVATALGARIPASALVASVMLANIAKSLSITPGGIVVYEGVVSAVLVSVGVPLDTAVLVGLLDHALKKSFNLAVGGIVMYRFGFACPSPKICS